MSDLTYSIIPESAQVEKVIRDENIMDGKSLSITDDKLNKLKEILPEAFKAGYKSLAEIGKERIRRVIKKIGEDQDGKQDLGFKVLKLRESNFKIWRSKIETEEELVEQLKLHFEPLYEHAKIEDVLYELLLKFGVSLTTKIEAKNGYAFVNDGEIALMLEKVDAEIIKIVMAEKPNKVIILDRLFKNNDQLKINTALQMKDAGIEFKAV